jgi:hypothetical protein
MAKTAVHGETKTYVKIYYPGILFSEDEVVEVDHRDGEKIAKKYKNAYAFRFYDQAREDVVIDGCTQTVFGEERNSGKTCYPGGEVLTLADVKRLPGDYKILIGNMKCNGYKKVVRSRLGNFQPFDDAKDEIV